MEEVMNNIPYCVVGGTANPMPKIQILLTAEGLKEIVKRLNDDDMVRITQWADYTNECKEVKHYQRISRVVKK